MTQRSAVLQLLARQAVLGAVIFGCGWALLEPVIDGGRETSLGTGYTAISVVAIVASLALGVWIYLRRGRHHLAAVVLLAAGTWYLAAVSWIDVPGVLLLLAGVLSFFVNDKSWDEVREAFWGEPDSP